jgi:ketosteroid isomerase-like protein
MPEGRTATAGLAPVSAPDMAKYAAMRPYFQVVAEGLAGLVDGTDFFDMHAEDVVVEYVITVPDYPRSIVGRDALAELYANYGDSIVQSGSSEVYRYYDPDKSVVVLEYTMHGTVVSTGDPYVNRFISVITIRDRKIAHWRDYLDPLAVIAAFGNGPAPY